MYMSWFSFILSSNFIFLCIKLKIIHYQTREQREIKFKPRIKLNHNTYTWFKRGRFGYWSIATQANHCNEFLRNAQMPNVYRQWPISKAAFMELGIQGWYKGNTARFCYFLMFRRYATQNYTFRFISQKNYLFQFYFTRKNDVVFFLFLSLREKEQC